MKLASYTLIASVIVLVIYVITYLCLRSIERNQTALTISYTNTHMPNHRLHILYFDPAFGQNFESSYTAQDPKAHTYTHQYEDGRALMQIKGYRGWLMVFRPLESMELTLRSGN